MHLLCQSQLDVNIVPHSMQPSLGTRMPVPIFDRLGGRAIYGRPGRQRRVVPRQFDFYESAGWRLEYLAARACVAFHDPQMIHCKPKRFAQYREIDLQTIVQLQRTAREEPQPGLCCTGGNGNLHLADRRAAMTHGVPVGDFLVLV